MKTAAIRNEQTAVLPQGLSIVRPPYRSHVTCDRATGHQSPPMLFYGYRCWLRTLRRAVYPGLDGLAPIPYA